MNVEVLMADPAESARPLHLPVMPAQVVRWLAPVPGGVYADVTVGIGGHAAAILQACPGARVVGFDRDAQALAAARQRLAAWGDRVTLIHSSFGELARCSRDLATFAGIVADLGLSSLQLDTPERGMSFRLEGPLDMRMDPSRGETALELIERLDQDELADVIYQLGEERRARRVARCLKQALASGELRTTHDLRRAVVRAVGPRRIGGIDPATRTFQALRMAVNHELAELDALLSIAPSLLDPGGVAVILAFHSLEDRRVKHAFLDAARWERLTPKPIVADEEEREQNPRSRSAKLRAARRRAAASERGA